MAQIFPVMDAKKFIICSGPPSSSTVPLDGRTNTFLYCWEATLTLFSDSYFNYGRSWGERVQLQQMLIDFS
jgi:hypothetical protein